MHKTLSSHSNDYWNFSFHEIGYYDVPAMIDHVLAATNSSQIFYVGHSQGSTSLMVLLSMRPEYNAKIIEAHLMAPAVFMTNMPHLALRFISSEFDSYVESHRAYDFLSSAQIMKFIEPVASTLCQKNLPTINVCTNLLQNICGKNDNEPETDVNTMSIIFKYLARAISTKQINHFIQLYQSRKFQQYNYKFRNAMIYNQTSPPEYNLDNVKAPMHIYVAKNDMLVSEKVN